MSDLEFRYVDQPIILCVECLVPARMVSGSAQDCGDHIEGDMVCACCRKVFSVSLPVVATKARKWM